MIDAASFASFKLQNAIEAIIGLQEGCREPRFMQVYQAIELNLKAIQYAVNEGMATRRMYAAEREERINLINRLAIAEEIIPKLIAENKDLVKRVEILERLNARQGSVAPSDSPANTHSSAANPQTGS